MSGIREAPYLQKKNNQVVCFETHLLLSEDYVLQMGFMRRYEIHAVTYIICDGVNAKLDPSKYFQTL